MSKGLPYKEVRVTVEATFTDSSSRVATYTFDPDRFEIVEVHSRQAGGVRRAVKMHGVIQEVEGEERPATN